MYIYIYRSCYIHIVYADNNTSITICRNIIGERAGKWAGGRAGKTAAINHVRALLSIQQPTFQQITTLQ